MKHVGNQDTTYLCRHCGVELSRRYYPGTTRLDGTTELIPGAWVHVSTNDRQCRSRLLGLPTNRLAEPTEWIELGE